MLYFLDTDFIIRGDTLELISIGVVAEDGREYFAISTEFNIAHAPPRMWNDILSGLPEQSSDLWKNRVEIRADLNAFIGNDPTPEVWGHRVAFSFVLLVQLWGLEAPEAFPLLCYELQQLLDSRCETTPEKTGRSTALDGARWTRQVYMQCIGGRGGEDYQPGDIVDVDYILPLPRGRRRFLGRGIVEDALPRGTKQVMVQLIGKNGRKNGLRVSLPRTSVRLIYRS